MNCKNIVYVIKLANYSIRLSQNANRILLRQFSIRSMHRIFICFYEHLCRKNYILISALRKVGEACSV